MRTLRLLLAARDGCDEALAARLAEEARAAVKRLGAGARACGLRRLTADPFAAAYPGRRAFDGVLCVDAPAGTLDDALVDVARGADERLGDLVHDDLCGALVGERRRILGSEGPQRFLYAMRHRAGLSTRAFQEHWGGPHADFGRRTPGICGYDQLHVDPHASRAAARVAGFAVWRIDGLAELQLPDAAGFATAAVGSPVGRAALEDERSFVDGENSVGFCCDVVVRVAEPPAPAREENLA